jgi:hypothetical protein
MTRQVKNIIARSALLLGSALLLLGWRMLPAEHPPTAAIRSVYTSLEDCRLVSTDEETGSSTQRCPGVRGYTLEVYDDDARMSIAVLAPGGAKHDLDYWQVITHGFSSLGQRAEWRLQTEAGRTRPIALIVRVNASEDPEYPERNTSYLAVARITSQRICVTDSIAPGAEQNVRARQAADRSAGRPCLEPRQY